MHLYWCCFAKIDEFFASLSPKKKKMRMLHTGTPIYIIEYILVMSILPVCLPGYLGIIKTLMPTLPMGIRYRLDETTTTETVKFIFTLLKTIELPKSSIHSVWSRTSVSCKFSPNWRPSSVGISSGPTWPSVVFLGDQFPSKANDFG